MRQAVGLFGLFCGAIVIVLVGRYGFKTTDIEADAWVTAFLFAAIASAALFGHALSVRLWRYSRPAAIGFGIVSLVALLLNLSNSLGAIAGRGDTAALERIATNRAVRAAESELKRLEGLRSAMPAFAPVTEDALSAARKAALAAEISRKAECDQRGKHCRQREADELAANNRLVTASADKGAADRAADLEGKAQAERDKLAKLGPIVTENSQGSALARLFRLPDDEAGWMATIQQFGLAAVVELIILMCLIAWEVLGREERKPKARKEEPAALEPAIALSKPGKPRLVSSKAGPPIGAVAEIMTEALEPAKGERITLEDCFLEYRRRCEAAGKAYLSPDQFLDAMAAFCREAGLKTKIANDRLYLMSVRLSDHAFVTSRA